MGLFNKLKNALFEEEEIEIAPSIEKKVEKIERTESKTETKTVVKEEPKIKEDLPLENERDLFKVENTFNFPDFDEEEFVNSYEPPKEEKPMVTPTPKESYERVRNVSPIGYDEEIRRTRETRINREKTQKPTKKQVEKPAETKTFHPSPVISPVYGVLDKNYKKEDIIPVEKQAKEKLATNVDMARKKAFGTLEDEIEMTLNEPTEEFYNENSKSIDDLLNDSIDETIEIPYVEKEDNFDIEPETEMKNFANSIEEEFSYPEENFDELPEEKETNEQYLEENTLESDLFDLIDSMYDNREEE